MQDQGFWSDCPSGVVTEMAGELRRRRRQTQLRPFIAAGLALLLICAVSYGLVGRDDSIPRARLNCRETVPLLAKYHDRSLDADVANDVREHLSHCPKCRKHYEDNFPSEVRNRSSAETRPIAMSTQLRRTTAQLILAQIDLRGSGIR